MAAAETLRRGGLDLPLTVITRKNFERFLLCVSIDEVIQFGVSEGA